MLPKLVQPDKINSASIQKALVTELYELELERRMLISKTKYIWALYVLGLSVMVSGFFLFFYLNLVAGFYASLGAIILGVVIIVQAVGYELRQLTRLRKYFEEELYPRLLPLLLPGFEYTAAPSFKAARQDWPEAGQYAQIFTKSAKHGILGRLEPLKVAIYELELRKNISDTRNYSYSFPLFKGIYMEISGLPENFKLEQLHEARLRAAKSHLANYWSASIDMRRSHSGALLLFIHTKKSFIDPPLRNTQPYHTAPDFTFFYEPLYACLHFVEWLREEMSQR